MLLQLKACILALVADVTTLIASTGLPTTLNGSKFVEIEKVATSWYAGWHASDFPLSAVSWDKYTQVTYAFGCVSRQVIRIASSHNTKHHNYGSVNNLFKHLRR